MLERRQRSIQTGRFINNPPKKRGEKEKEGNERKMLYEQSTVLR